SYFQRDRDDLLAQVEERRHREYDAGEDRDHQREEQHFGIERNLGGARNAFRISGQHRTQSGETKRSASGAADEREKNPFSQELPQQPPLSGAERRADRELPLPRFRPREQQVREVRAGDQQHESDSAL